MPTPKFAKNEATHRIDIQDFPAFEKVNRYADPTIEKDIVTPKSSNAMEKSCFGNGVLSPF